jgi:hypothetical protein
MASATPIPTSAETLRRLDELIARQSSTPETARRLKILRRLVEATESGDASAVMTALRSASSVAPGHLAPAIQKTVLLGQSGREIHAEYPLASGLRVRLVKVLAPTQFGATIGRSSIEIDPCESYVGTAIEYTPVECGGEVDAGFDASPYEPEIAAQAAEGDAVVIASDALYDGTALRASKALVETEQVKASSAGVNPACRGERAATIAAAVAVAYGAGESLYWGVVVKNPMQMLRSIVKTGGLIGAAWVAYEFERACAEAHKAPTP